MSKSVGLYSTSWRGGDGWYTHALADAMATALASSGRSLTLIASPMTPASRDACHPSIDRRVFRPGTSAGGARLRKLLGTAARALEATGQLLKARASCKTIVITFPHWASVTWVQFVMLWTLRTRIIYIVHDPSPHAWGHAGWRRALHRFAIRTTYGLSQALVTLSPAGRIALRDEWGIDPAKVSVIPHGIFDNGERQAPTRNRTFLIFGMLRSNKNILPSIEAFAELLHTYPDARLVIAGAPYGAEPEYWQQCEQRLSRLGESVHTEIGFVPEERLEQLFDSCDAVLLPYDNFNSQSGVAVLSALAMRPVLGTAVGGLKDLFELGMSGVQITEPPSREAILRAMKRYCDTPPERWAVQLRQARTELLSALDWQRIGVRFADLASSLDPVSSTPIQTRP